MPKIELLNATKHSCVKIETGADSKFDDISPMAQVAANELSKLVLDFPIFITKNPNTGEFELTALLGFSAGENLFLNGGKWNAAYVPLDTRRHPLQAIVIEGGDEPNAQVKIGINVESNRLSDKGQALFNIEGKPTKLLSEISDLLGLLMNELQLTKVFLKTLSDLSLIEPVRFDVQLDGESKVSFDGLYTVHAEKMNLLSELDVYRLHQKGYLQACHAIIHSLGHVDKLLSWRTSLPGKS